MSPVVNFDRLENGTTILQPKYQIPPEYSTGLQDLYSTEYVNQYFENEDKQMGKILFEQNASLLEHPNQASSLWIPNVHEASSSQIIDRVGLDCVKTQLVMQDSNPLSRVSGDQKNRIQAKFKPVREWMDRIINLLENQQEHDTHNNGLELTHTRGNTKRK